MSRHHQGPAARHRNNRAAWLNNTDRTCWLCLQPGADTIHDLIPASAGGDQGNPTNWVPAHRACNASVGVTIVARGCLAQRAERPANHVHSAISNFEFQNSKISNNFLKFENEIHPAPTPPRLCPPVGSADPGRSFPPPGGLAGPCNTVHGAVVGDGG